MTRSAADARDHADGTAAPSEPGWQGVRNSRPTGRAIGGGRSLTATEVLAREGTAEHGDILREQAGAFTYFARTAMRIRVYLLLVSAALGLAAIVLTLALVGTPEVTRFLALCASAALGSDAVGLLIVAAAVAFLGSVAARAWAIAARGHDETSFMDDSPSPLPDEWRKPADVLRFNRNR